MLPSKAADKASRTSPSRIINHTHLPMCHPTGRNTTLILYTAEGMEGLQSERCEVKRRKGQGGSERTKIWKQNGNTCRYVIFLLLYRPRHETSYSLANTVIMRVLRDIAREKRYNDMSSHQSWRGYHNNNSNNDDAV